MPTWNSEELKTQYDLHRDNAKRYSAWSALDNFVVNLIGLATGKEVHPVDNVVKMPIYAFDSEGTPVPHEDYEEVK